MIGNELHSLALDHAVIVLERGEHCEQLELSGVPLCFLLGCLS